tara:strand:+ start:9309 stop:9971 length:663 start_codon:yes stop_codon:yes gene_type:complete
VDNFSIAIVVTIVLLVVGGITYSIIYEKKRKQKLKETAEEMGLTFSPDGDPHLLTRFSDFKLFNVGRGRRMSNLIQGDSGEVKIAIFEYKYTTGSGKNSKTRHQSVVSLHSPDLVCPDFTIRPENFLDRIGSALGFQDIDFDDHPEFSSKFVLQGSDEQQLRQYFNQVTLDFFTARPNICVEAQSGTMFYYRVNKRIKADKVKDNLSEAYEVFGMMVDHA